MNVALYGAPARWAMTERGLGAVVPDAASLSIGPSAMHWEGDGLTIGIEEVSVPHMARLRGRIRVLPEGLTDAPWRLDPEGRHLWQPFAPSARIEVVFDRPSLCWSGRGYFDTNYGERPLEADFASWTWSRSILPDGAAVFFDTERHDGGAGALSLRFGRGGSAEPVEAPPTVPLPRTLWRLDRQVRADAGTRPFVLRRMEDAPFYARAAVRSCLWGQEVEGVHEVLDLGRFDTHWCRLMLPFRMPRRAAWKPG